MRLLRHETQVLSPTRRRGRRRAAEAQLGQTLPLICFFMMSLLGVSGLVLDLGNGYTQRRAIQNEADAAAIAGADAIVSGNYSSAAQQMAAKNGRPADQVSVTFDGTDTVTVTVSRIAPTFFLKVFGKSSIPVSATAVARLEALAAVRGHVSPYAVKEDAYANGVGHDALQGEPARRVRHDRPADDRQPDRRELLGEHQQGHPLEHQPGAVRPAPGGPARDRRLPVGEVGRVAAVGEHREPDPAREQPDEPGSPVARERPVPGDPAVVDRLERPAAQADVHPDRADAAERERPDDDPRLRVVLHDERDRRRQRPHDQRPVGQRSSCRPPGTRRNTCRERSARC